jgi:protein phosphatase
VIQLCADVKQIFADESVSLELPGPVVIVGDLHGQVLDLFRILRSYGPPVDRRYLFLGDIVDRGEFSLETCTLLFALKVRFPAAVYSIRGNHEFRFLCERCGFQAELAAVYGPDGRVFEAFLDAFSVMPLTAVIGRRLLCVHGGLGPRWFSLSQARQVERPLHDFGDDIVDAMLWSDPHSNVQNFEPSVRGSGFLFGPAALNEFLDTNGLLLLVRGHECVNSGCHFMFDDRVVTVFSASNYGGMISNNAAVLDVAQDCQWTVQRFQPLQYLKRGAAQFGRIVNGVFRPVIHIKRITEPAQGRQGVARLPSLGQVPRLETPGRGIMPKSQTPRVPLMRLSRRI